VSDNFAQELLAIADELDALAARAEGAAIKKPLEALDQAAEAVGRSWSNSWLGYHAFVYYADLRPSPPGVHFSQEWGIRHRHTIRDTSGDWREYDPDVVEKHIRKLAKNPDLSAINALALEASKAFLARRAECLSLLTVVHQTSPDPYIETVKNDIDALEINTASDFINYLQPKGQLMTRDSLAASQGYRTPQTLPFMLRFLLSVVQ
jgi:hypothetical protein